MPCGRIIFCMVQLEPTEGERGKTKEDQQTNPQPIAPTPTVTVFQNLDTSFLSLFDIFTPPLHFIQECTHCSVDLF